MENIAELTVAVAEAGFRDYLEKRGYDPRLVFTTPDELEMIRDWVSLELCRGFAESIAETPEWPYIEGDLLLHVARLRGELSAINYLDMCMDAERDTTKKWRLDSRKSLRKRFGTLRSSQTPRSGV